MPHLRRGKRPRVPVSAGSQLAAARTRIAQLEAQLGAGVRDGRARSLLRQVLPFLRHRTECGSRNRSGPEVCTCELDDLRHEIDELFDE